MTVAEMLDRKTGWWMRMMIAGDAILALGWRDGVPGVTMSSRMGTAAAHGHRWGSVSFWLLDRCWPFRKDPTTGESHCVGAEKSDSIRAVRAIRECLGDPVVVEKHGLQQFKRELLVELTKILED